MNHATREAFPILFGSCLDLCLSLVGAIKSAAYSLTLSSGEQLHSVSLKSGLLHSNVFVSNSLLHLYARRGHLLSARRLFLSATLVNNASWNILLAAHVRFPCPDLYHARVLFDEIPHKDRVSFTTMIMGLSKNGSSVESLALFRDMMVAGVTPNDVTLASVLSSCSRLNDGVGWTGKMVHAVAVKCGLDELLLVATNLVHDYVVTLNFEDAEAVFDRMPEKNIVTWNVLLKGYAKAGWINAARSVFERTPDKDLVSWGTMIDGFLLASSLEEALLAFRQMLQDIEARPNEVMLVNLLSACCHCSAICEGQQLHSVILKVGLDSHQFVHTTLIHFYGKCHMMDLSLLLFQSRSNDNISSWNAVIAGFLRNNELNAARQLFDDMPDRDVVSWSTMIAGYAQHRQHDLALELFHAMQSTGIQPNEITLVSVLSAIAGCGSFEEGKRVHHYINKNFVPLTDNLCAGLIDMYAKCGRIHKAVCLFDYLRIFAGVSSWNAIISGLAMHGHADESLALFSSLLETRIKPNSITFLGVLSACCHAGLVAVGRRHFESMKNVYGLQPNLKHYGCMVDLLGRAGLLEEAEELIASMPMEADVVIWGSMLSSARTHQKVEFGERAAEKLARLDPGHEAGRVLMSNIYADADRWDEVSLVRRAMWSGGLKKDAGQSCVH